MRVAIIGAGPSGLVTLKYLLAAHSHLGNAPIDARLFESEKSVGGTFLVRTYEKAELVSSKQLTSFSDFRPGGKGDFMTTNQYVEYLQDYATQNHLWPHMFFSCFVTKLRKQGKGGYSLVYEHEGVPHTWECDAVAVCSGLHIKPNIPHVEGIENVGVKFHSSQFKSSEQFGNDKTVLVLGSGETSADICHLAITSPTARVVMSHKRGFHLAPKTNANPKLVLSRPRYPDAIPQIPIDVSRASLFDTAYVHPWLRNSDILWQYYDCYLRWILWLSWGTINGQDQWIGGKPKWSASEMFFNKAGHKIAPYLKHWKSTYKHGWAEYLRQIFVTHRLTTETGGRIIDVAPWPKRVDADGFVQFQDNHGPEYAHMKDVKIKPDIVIFSTGYTADFSFLENISADVDMRGIWKQDAPEVGFIGFMRPNLGAIPPLAEQQAQLWILNLLAPERVNHPLLPQDEAGYRLKSKETARLHCGVDHESYAYQLALDAKSAPSFTDVVRLGYSDPLSPWWKLPIAWAFGANITSKFRLVGPWQWDGAVDVMTGEVWDMVKRREIFFGTYCYQYEASLAQFQSANKVHRTYHPFPRTDAHLWPFQSDSIPYHVRC